MACVAVTLHSPWYPVEIIDKVTLFNNKIASNMSLSVCLCSKMTKRAPASRAVIYHGVVGVCTVRHGLHRSILGVYRLGQRIWPAMSRNRLEISLDRELFLAPLADCSDGQQSHETTGSSLWARRHCSC